MSRTSAGRHVVGTRSVARPGRASRWARWATIGVVAALSTSQVAFAAPAQTKQRTPADSGVGSGIDLAPGSVTVIPSSPRPGERVHFSSFVRNTGDRAARAFDSTLAVDGSVIGTVHLRMLGAGQKARLDFGPWLAIAGSHNAVITVDAHDGVNESDEQNNSSYATFDVIPSSLGSRSQNHEKLADLVALDVKVLRGEAIEGDYTELVAEVANQGLADASGFTVSFSVDGAPLGTSSVDRLARGASTQVSSPPWKVSVGTHLVKMIVDPRHAVTETRRDNNFVDSTIALHALTAAPPAGMNLSVDDLAIKTASLDRGQATTLSVDACNTGTQPITAATVMLSARPQLQIVPEARAAAPNDHIDEPAVYIGEQTTDRLDPPGTLAVGPISKVGPVSKLGPRAGDGKGPAPTTCAHLTFPWPKGLEAPVEIIASGALLTAEQQRDDNIVKLFVDSVTPPGDGGDGGSGGDAPPDQPITISPEPASAPAARPQPVATHHHHAKATTSALRTVRLAKVQYASLSVPVPVTPFDMAGESAAFLVHTSYAGGHDHWTMPVGNTASVDVDEAVPAVADVLVVATPPEGPGPATVHITRPVGVVTSLPGLKIEVVVPKPGSDLTCGAPDDQSVPPRIGEFASLGMQLPTGVTGLPDHFDFSLVAATAETATSTHLQLAPTLVGLDHLTVLGSTFTGQMARQDVFASTAALAPGALHHACIAEHHDGLDATADLSPFPVGAIATIDSTKSTDPDGRERDATHLTWVAAGQTPHLALNLHSYTNVTSGVTVDAEIPVFPSRADATFTSLKPVDGAQSAAETEQLTWHASNQAELPHLAVTTNDPTPAKSLTIGGEIFNLPQDINSLVLQTGPAAGQTTLDLVPCAGRARFACDPAPISLIHLSGQSPAVSTSPASPTVPTLTFDVRATDVPNELHLDYNPTLHTTDDPPGGSAPAAYRVTRDSRQPVYYKTFDFQGNGGVSHLEVTADQVGGSHTHLVADGIPNQVYGTWLDEHTATTDNGVTGGVYLDTGSGGFAYDLVNQHTLVGPDGTQIPADPIHSIDLQTTNQTLPVSNEGHNEHSYALVTNTTSVKSVRAHVSDLHFLDAFTTTRNQDAPIRSVLNEVDAWSEPGSFYVRSIDGQTRAVASATTLPAHVSFLADQRLNISQNPPTAVAQTYSMYGSAGPWLDDPGPSDVVMPDVRVCSHGAGDACTGGLNVHIGARVLHSALVATIKTTGPDAGSVETWTDGIEGPTVDMDNSGDPAASGHFRTLSLRNLVLPHYLKFSFGNGDNRLITRTDDSLHPLNGVVSGELFVSRGDRNSEFSHGDFVGIPNVVHVKIDAQKNLYALWARIQSLNAFRVCVSPDHLTNPTGDCAVDSQTMQQQGSTTTPLDHVMNLAQATLDGGHAMAIEVDQPEDRPMLHVNLEQTPSDMSVAWNDRAGFFSPNSIVYQSNGPVDNAHVSLLQPALNYGNGILKVDVAHLPSFASVSWQTQVLQQDVHMQMPNRPGSAEATTDLPLCNASWSLATFKIESHGPLYVSLMKYVHLEYPDARPADSGHIDRWGDIQVTDLNLPDRDGGQLNIYPCNSEMVPEHLSMWLTFWAQRGHVNMHVRKYKLYYTGRPIPFSYLTAFSTRGRDDDELLGQWQESADLQLCDNFRGWARPTDELPRVWNERINSQVFEGYWALWGYYTPLGNPFARDQERVCSPIDIVPPQ